MNCPSGRTGKPEDELGFVKLAVDDLTVYVSHEIWDGLRADQPKLLVAVCGYGRFWLHLQHRADDGGIGPPERDVR